MAVFFFVLVLVANVLCYQHRNESVWNHFEKVKADDIGRGTFGVCYLVRPLHTVGPAVAVKVMQPKSNLHLALKIPELQTQNVVSSPFVPQIHFSFWDTTVPQLALIMDYGGPFSVQSLDHRIAIKTFKSEHSELTIFIAANLIRALVDIHSAKVFHRDFMLYNMVVSEDGYINVIDFGNAIANATKQQMDTDTEKLCRIVYRYLMFTPNRLGLPDLQIVRNYVRGIRFQQVYKNSTTISDFLKQCVTLPKVESLMKHPLFDNFDWHALESKQLQSPLKHIVEEAMIERHRHRPGL